MVYQNVNVMVPLIKALEEIKPEGTKVIWRDAFRWMDREGVLSNHYECQSISSLAEEHGYIIEENFNHVAIVRKKYEL